MLSGLGGSEAAGWLADLPQGGRGLWARSCQKHPACLPMLASSYSPAPWKLPVWGRGASLGRAGLALEDVQGEGLLGVGGWGEHCLQAPPASLAVH